jgi:hypothetical protein
LQVEPGALHGCTGGRDRSTRLRHLRIGKRDLCTTLANLRGGQLRTHEEVGFIENHQHVALADVPIVVRTDGGYRARDARGHRMHMAGDEGIGRGFGIARVAVNRDADGDHDQRDAHCA